MGTKTLVIICALLFSLTLLTPVTPAPSAEDQKHQWTVTAKCTNKVKTLTETHCGTKREAIAAVKGKLRQEKGCEQIEVVSVEKGEKCN